MDRSPFSKVKSDAGELESYHHFSISCILAGIQTVAKVRDQFRTFKTLEVPFRKTQLKSLQKLVTENKQKITDALYKDLRKVSSLKGCLYKSKHSLS